MRAALTTASRFNSGSPWPIKTTLIRSPSRLESVVARGQQHLADDLSSSQVALQSQQRRETEPAAYSAPGLAGDANRVALLLGHEYGFDAAPVLQAQQIAAGAIHGFVTAFDFG